MPRLPYTEAPLAAVPVPDPDVQRVQEVPPGEAPSQIHRPAGCHFHSHPEHEPAYRGIREAHGLSTMYMSGLFERSQSFFGTDDAFHDANAEFAYCELLKSGVTTLVDISPPWDNWAPLLARSGLRAYLAPGFASARWKLENEYELKYLWDEKLGRERMDTALKVVDAAVAHPSRRLGGVVAPMQIGTCTPELLRDALAAARDIDFYVEKHIIPKMRDVEQDYRPQALAEINVPANSVSAEMRGLVRALLRRRRRVIETDKMDPDTIAHTLPDGRVIYHFEQGGREGGLIAFLYVKDDIFYLLSVSTYQGRWNVQASETSYFQALSEAVRRIDEI